MAAFYFLDKNQISVDLYKALQSLGLTTYRPLLPPPFPLPATALTFIRPLHRVHSLMLFLALLTLQISA